MVGPHLGMFVEGVVRTVGLRMLVDTGATDTIINAAIYYQIPERMRPELKRHHITIRQADGSALPILGAAWVELCVGKSVHTVCATFAPIEVDGILGTDFLVPLKGVVDFGKLELNLNGLGVKCTDRDGGAWCARVIVEDTTVIPAGHEAVVPGAIASSWVLKGIGIIEPVEQGSEAEKKGLIVGRSVVDSANGTLGVRVLNPGKKECIVKTGTTIGVLSPVDPQTVQTYTDPSKILSVTSAEIKQSAGRIEVPPHLEELYKRAIGSLSKTDHGKVVDLLVEYQDVFSKGSDDIGQTGLVKHSINTGDARPIKQRPRRHPISQQEEISNQVQDLKARSLIEPSDSPWAANVVLVRKKDGTQRFCVDYRQLNAITIKDAYPVPRIDDTLDSLSGARWFSTLDLASGYWQIDLDEDAKKKSAFVVRDGLYSWKVMPFGLCNAPATFERLMERVLAGLQWDTLLVYLDDVIVYGKSVDEELGNLKAVLERFRTAGLKLKPQKCYLFQEEVRYLGHVVSKEGVRTDPDKVEAVKGWPTPSCIKEVRSFLGLASYYRRFIRGFADIAKPLHRLTEKTRQFVWDDECEAAFMELKARLQDSPLLAYPRPGEEYILDTDASGVGIGGVLSQVQDGVERPVAYASRALKKPERNYCVTRRELLAVVVYLKHFRPYIYGQKVTIRTDHASLRWILNLKDPEGQLARWLEVITEYDFQVVHRPGVKHANADGLSRKPCRQCGRGEEEVDQGSRELGVLGCTQELNSGNAPEGRPTVSMVTREPWCTNEMIREAQEKDETMGWLLKAKRELGVRPSWDAVTPATTTTKTYWLSWDRIALRDGVLCRRWESDTGAEIRWQILLPSGLHATVLDELHGGKTGGHLGHRKTVGKVRQRYYWVGSDAAVRSWVRKCNGCARKKPPPRKPRAALQQRVVSEPMARVALDLVGPLVGDYFTKWVEAYPLPDATAETVAGKMVEEYFCRFGMPTELHSDQGRNFESHVFSEVCTILGIKKTRTTPYNPKSDGFIERFNRTLITMVAVMIDPNKKQRDWDKQLPYAMFAYRSSPQESTGEANVRKGGFSSTGPHDGHTSIGGTLPRLRRKA